MREEGLEPSRLAAQEPKSCVSAVPPLSRPGASQLAPPSSWARISAIGEPLRRGVRSFYPSIPGRSIAGPEDDRAGRLGADPTHRPRKAVKAGRAGAIMYRGASAAGSRRVVEAIGFVFAGRRSESTPAGAAVGFVLATDRGPRPARSGIVGDFPSSRGAVAGRLGFGAIHGDRRGRATWWGDGT